MTNGLEALLRHAPLAAEAMQQMESTMWVACATDDLTDNVQSCADLCAEQHGLRSLSDGVARESPTTAVRRFAEQFSADVAAISDGERLALFETLGPRAGNFVLALFVVDVVPRGRAALDAVFGATPGWPPPGATDRSELWPAIDAFIRAVPRLDEVDAITTELVRLRGARQHDCRLCQSLRSRPSLLAGADDHTFAAIDDYGSGHLSPPQVAALALTDAIIWTPSRIEPQVVAVVREHFAPAQIVEIVLDVMRNAANKIAVSLRADAPHVSEGYEIYDVDADGELIYGLTL